MKVDRCNVIWHETKNVSIGENTRDRWLQELLEKTPVNDIWYICSGDSMVVVHNSEEDGIEVYDLVIRRNGYIPKAKKGPDSTPSKPDEHVRMVNFFFPKK